MEIQKCMNGDPKEENRNNRHEKKMLGAVVKEYFPEL